ncbi:MAG: alpha-amylase family glycosyl hydrolase [Christensenellales bacterium]|nr:alpha-amylase family glycosyl hydrolase [Christensenellales bacterium]
MKVPAKRKKYKILSIDPWLEPFSSDIQLRMDRHAETRQKLLGDSSDLAAFANGYLFYGLHRTENGWVFREWAPGADAVHLIGDFNNWNRSSHPLTRMDNGVWEIHIDSVDALCHGQRIKLQITRCGSSFDRIPTYARYALQDPLTHQYSAIVWSPAHAFKWTDGGYGKRKVAPLFIYESHIGMAQEEECIGTYRQFADSNLKRIHELGYNTVQLMAIMEHPYYASFGYQVTNFFAASSRFGDPDDLKYLINRAHELGMYVLLDVVHSHACGNVGEGLNQFDGTEDQFFPYGERGNHPAWGTKLFNYGKHEVIHYLLSNLKFWMEEYHFDGFRFDGITSMLYHDHGLGTAFSGYDQYFNMNVNTEAVTYLQLANELIHLVNPFAVTIAEDMSGMPGMCIPIRSGGIGFDYRLAMGIPDFWVKQVKDVPDHDWDIYKMWHELTTRRPKEKCVGYCESHDQALVGDQTLIFRMAEAEMYYGMEKSFHSITVDRAVALHKMIRFITLVLGCDAYLNFMGNEFGHPEWIDFPREGNGWSYKYARRQWSLPDNRNLKYEWLQAFDVAMLKFARKHRVLNKSEAHNLWMDPTYKIIAFAKGDLIYLFNFSHSSSLPSFFLPAHLTGGGKYRAIFSTDRAEFGGMDRISEKYVYYASDCSGRGIGFEVYTPCRTAAVFQKISD